MSNSVISECWKRRLHAVFRRSQKSFACGPYLAATEWEDRKRSRWFNLWSFEFSSFQSCASLHFFSRISHYLILNVLPLASCEVGLLWLLCLYILVWSFHLRHPIFHLRGTHLIMITDTINVGIRSQQCSWRGNTEPFLLSMEVLLVLLLCLSWKRGFKHW